MGFVAAPTEMMSESDELTLFTPADSDRIRDNGILEVWKARECRPCVFAKANGYWGDTIPAGWTHCRDCHKSWPGTQKWGHCAACHHTFSGQRAFDDHHSAKECPLGAPRRGLKAKWSGARYVVKQHERGGFFYWGSDVDV